MLLIRCALLLTVAALTVACGGFQPPPKYKRSNSSHAPPAPEIRECEAVLKRLKMGACLPHGSEPTSCEESRGITRRICSCRPDAQASNAGQWHCRSEKIQLTLDDLPGARMTVLKDHVRLGIRAAVFGSGGPVQGVEFLGKRTIDRENVSFYAARHCPGESLEGTYVTGQLITSHVRLIDLPDDRVCGKRPRGINCRVERYQGMETKGAVITLRSAGSGYRFEADEVAMDHLEDALDRGKYLGVVSASRDGRYRVTTPSWSCADFLPGGTHRVGRFLSSKTAIFLADDACMVGDRVVTPSGIAMEFDSLKGAQKARAVFLTQSSLPQCTDQGAKRSDLPTKADVTASKSEPRQRIASAIKLAKCQDPRGNRWDHRAFVRLESISREQDLRLPSESPNPKLARLLRRVTTFGDQVALLPGRRYLPAADTGLVGQAELPLRWQTLRPCLDPEGNARFRWVIKRVTKRYVAETQSCETQVEFPNEWGVRLPAGIPVLAEAFVEHRGSCPPGAKASLVRASGD